VGGIRSVADKDGRSGKRSMATCGASGSALDQVVRGSFGSSKIGGAMASVLWAEGEVGSEERRKSTPSMRTESVGVVEDRQIGGA
jgi:hypothetical protein